MIELEELGPAEGERFTRAVEATPWADFRQTFEWGQVRAQEGWRPRHFLARRGGKVVGTALVLAGRLPHLPFTLLHAPCGPLVDFRDSEVVRALASLLAQLAREEGACFARIDPALLAGEGAAHEALLGAGFVHSPLAWSYWNTPTEVLRIALDRDEEELFRGLRPAQRRNLRRFESLGHRTEVSKDPEDFWRLHRLLLDLGQRKGFIVRGARYWQALWDSFLSRGRGVLVTARAGEQTLGYMLNLVCGRTCFFLHGADDPAHSADRPSSALYWASIRHARALGCTVFDLMGHVSESHLRFKLSFGAERVRLAGYYDLVARPAAYRTFAALERHLLPRVVPLVVRLRRTRAATGDPVDGRDAS